MLDTAPTPSATLQKARCIGLRNGLHHVYVGNVQDPARQATLLDLRPALLSAATATRITTYELDAEGRLQGLRNADGRRVRQEARLMGPAPPAGRDRALRGVRAPRRRHNMSSDARVPRSDRGRAAEEEAGTPIGKPGAAKTAIAAASAERVIVRGRDLAGDLMGRTTFTEFFFLAATGRAPTEEQRFFLDLSLVAIAEHGLTPSVQAARMTYAAHPAALQGAVAAGVLGCGTVILGAADLCRQLIDDVLARAALIGSVEEAALAVAREHREARKPIAGYGHPLHKPVDPRAERMIALARERRVAGRSVEAALALRKAVAEVWRKPLPMNVSMAIAATLRDVDVPPRASSEPCRSSPAPPASSRTSSRRPRRRSASTSPPRARS